MKARVFFDAFAECVVNVALARQYPALRHGLREVSASRIAAKWGAPNAEATGHMFDRLWHDMQNPKGT